MDYPCRECGRRARYEVLPVSDDSRRMPAYWCRACWKHAFSSAGVMEAALGRLRAQGALRDLETGGNDAGAEERGRPA